MMRRSAATWQLILADLALILFLVTAAALSGEQQGAHSAGQPAPDASMAPSQALYRAGSDMPELGEWLDSQPIDPRAALTIVGTYAEGEADAVWAQARSLASQARTRGIRVRTIISAGDTTSVQASLGFDQPEQ